MKIVLGLVVGLCLLASCGGCSQKTEKVVATGANKSFEPTADNTADVRQEARRTYIANMRETLRSSDSDATVADVDGNLIITSAQLEHRSERNQFVSQTFNHEYKKSLCTLGFNTIEVRSSVILGSGDVYSLGCKQEKQEVEAQAESNRLARIKFAKDIQEKLGGTSHSSNIVFAANGSELVLIMPGSKQLSLQGMRASFTALMTPDARRGACEIGFTGMRVKDSSTDRGSFISYSCPKGKK